MGENRAFFLKWLCREKRVGVLSQKLRPVYHSVNLAHHAVGLEKEGGVLKTVRSPITTGGNKLIILGWVGFGGKGAPLTIAEGHLPLT